MTAHQRARAVVEQLTMEPTKGSFQADADEWAAKCKTTDELINLIADAIAAALEDEIEACAKVADQWEDSTQDIDCGVTMVSVLKSGRTDADSGIVIQEVDKLEPWEQRQAEMLGEYREVARREERRIVAAAIRQRKGAR